MQTLALFKAPLYGLIPATLWQQCVPVTVWMLVRAEDRAGAGIPETRCGVLREPMRDLGEPIGPSRPCNCGPVEHRPCDGPLRIQLINSPKLGLYLHYF